MLSQRDPLPASLTWARRALWTQIALTVVAVAVTAAAPFVISELVRTSQDSVVVGLAVASPLFVMAPLLIGAGVAGLVALRRTTWRLRAAIALLAPVLFVVGSGVETLLGGATPEVAPTGAGPLRTYQRFIELTLQVLTWAHWLALGAVCAGAVAAVLLLRVGRAPEGSTIH